MTNRHELSRYVLEDLLSCKVGCHFIACIRVSASGTPTEASYSDQALHIAEQRKHNNQTTETWRMADDAFYVMQGMLIRATLHDQLSATKLSTSRFKKSFFNKGGDFGFSFEGCSTILSIPWYDPIPSSYRDSARVLNPPAGRILPKICTPINGAAAPSPVRIGPHPSTTMSIMVLWWGGCGGFALLHP